MGSKFLLIINNNVVQEGPSYEFVTHGLPERYFGPMAEEFSVHEVKTHTVFTHNEACELSSLVKGQILKITREALKAKKSKNKTQYDLCKREQSKWMEISEKIGEMK